MKLKTAATPEMIKAKGYDTVLVSTGADIVISKMPGADGKNVFNILTAYSNKKDLGKNCGDDRRRKDRHRASNRHGKGWP